MIITTFIDFIITLIDNKIKNILLMNYKGCVGG